MIAENISELLLFVDQQQNTINKQQKLIIRQRKIIKRQRKTIKERQEHIDLLNDDIDELTRKPTDEDYDKLLHIIKNQKNTISELESKVNHQQEIIKEHIKVTIV